MKTFSSRCLGSLREADAGNSARRPSNFHLPAQMKVTKANGLNTSDLISTLRQEEIMTFERARNALGPHAAGPLALVPHSFRRRAQSHLKNPVPAVSGSNVPREISQAMIFSSRSVTTKSLVFEPLCFGDFHLGRQMKVTRPPGRDPAQPHAVEPPGEGPTSTSRE